MDAGIEPTGTYSRRVGVGKSVLASQDKINVKLAFILLFQKILKLKGVQL